MRSMEQLSKVSNEIKTGASDLTQVFQAARKEYDSMKATAENAAAGVDDEVASTIRAGIESGKESFRADMEGQRHELDTLQGKNAELHQEVDTKISANEASQSQLEGLRENRFAKGATDAIRAIQKNTETGKTAKELAQQAMEAAQQAMEQATRGL